MANFDRIDEGLNREEVAEIKVKVVTLSGISTYDVEEGMTVADFKSRYNLTGTKIVDADGETLSDNDELDQDIELFVSAAKKNG